jgi:hypothetical protein
MGLPGLFEWAGEHSNLRPTDYEERERGPEAPGGSAQVLIDPHSWLARHRVRQWCASHAGHNRS